jgi:DNA-binding GntR family transcriptional regulator
MLDKDSPLRLGSAPPRPGGKRVFAEERLRRAVIWCELEPGTVVTERGLMHRYGLKRAGVRAALVGLEAAGLVEALPRHGWRVRRISGAYIGDVVAARRAIEPSLPLGQLRAQQIARVEELTRLTSLLAGRQEAASRASLRAYDRELLETLAAGLGEIRRGWLREAWDHSERLVRFFERDGQRRFPPTDRKALAAACSARDGEAAHAALSAATDAFEAAVIAALYAEEAEIVGPGTAAAWQARRPRSVAPREQSKTPRRPSQTEGGIR